MNAISSPQANVTSQPVAESLLQDRIARTVHRYLTDLDDTECNEGLYQLVLHEIERPLLHEVMKWHEGNQSRAAATLGINRATLRKKLVQHGML